jgi:outer membrane protein OmpA-like peptidoglycan-associated protein
MFGTRFQAESGPVLLGTKGDGLYTSRSGEMGFSRMTKLLLRTTAIVAIMVGASGCSSVPDWADPTGWLDSSSPPVPQTADNSDNSATPDLANLPAKPTPESTPDEQKQVAESLASDRSQANYSAEALKGGTEASAPPPAPPTAADQAVAQAALSDTPKTAPAPAANTAAAASDSAPPAPAPAPAMTPAPDAPATAAPASAPPAPTPTATENPAPAPSEQPQQGTLPPPPPAPAATMAESQPPPPPAGAEPAVPLTATASTIAPSSAALGFKPSSAPPLDPSVAQFVPGPIMNRYHETASMAGISGPAAPAPAAAVPGPQSRRSERRVAGMGGPEAMSGAVVANFDALQPSAAATNVNATPYTTPTGAPVAVVFFPGDGTTLNGEGRAKVREAVSAFQASGGQGFVKVVGHSSSRTSNMPVEKHLEVIFQRSQARADAVAHELIREGIPASKVLIEAVGDSQPVYYESMPKGEDGNRRAEIFLQS